MKRLANDVIIFIKTRLKTITLELAVVAFFSDWAIISLINMYSTYHESRLKFITLNYLKKMNETDIFIKLIVVYILILLIFIISRSVRLRKCVLFISVFSYGLYSSTFTDSIYYCIGFMVIMTMVVIYCYTEKDVLGKSESEKLSDKMIPEKIPEIITNIPARMTLKSSQKITILIVALLGIWFVIYTGGMTTLRYLEYATPSMDFGIFSQMFHYMVKNFQQLTTCERDVLMSHFGVHISPVYYLLLPFYAIYQSPITLQICQAVVIALGLIPLYLLGRRFRLSNLEIVGSSICYAFYPALSMGCFYDLHENAFLPLFLLLLLYFIECDKLPGIIITTILVFSVKEDAPVYVAFIALYVIIDKKKYLKGAVLLIASILYFMFATFLVNKLGEGESVYLFSNVIYDDSNSLICIIKTVFFNPGYALQQLFLQDNLLFIFKVLAPLCFLPLIVKKWSQLILIGPFLLINLLSDYAYFHDISYQYLFGNIGILFYLMVSNIDNLKHSFRVKVVPLMAIFSVMMFVTLMHGKMYYWEDYQSSYDRNRWETMNEALDKIPKDASVTATTFLVPKLSDRDEIYDMTYTDEVTDYVALDLRIATTDYDINQYLKSDEYETVAYTQAIIGVFKRINNGN